MEKRKKNCFAAAAILKKHAANSFNPELANICAAGYTDMGQYLDEYTANVVIALDFIDEMLAGAYYLAEGEDVTEHKLEDATFNLFESIAVIMREEVLRNKSGAAPRQVQKAVLHCFETSGEWLAEDPTLVSEYYYHKIPDSLATEDDSPEPPDRKPGKNTDPHAVSEQRR